MEFFLQDLKQSFHMFLRYPGFTLTAIAALGLGIGTNTAIFSVVNAVLLKPVKAPEPDRVVMLLSTSSEGSAPVASDIKFNLWREQTDIFEDVSGYYFGSVNLTLGDQPQRANAIFVTRDYFHLFGLPIAKGRIFTNDEERPNGANAVILSEAFWKRALGGDSQIVGKTISLSGKSYEVTGIMPGDVRTEAPEPPDVWLPFPIDPNSTFQAHYFAAAARLKPGVTLQMANAQLQLTTQEFRRKYPDTISTHRGDVLSVEPMREVLVKDVRSPLLILAGAVSLVLLIACANTANLLLTRAIGRTREMAIRMAVGASRTRIIRQLLTESFLLSLAGGAFGLMLGTAIIHVLLSLNAAHLPRIGVKGSNVTTDWRVLLFTVLMALLTGLVFGLLPAFQASRTDLDSSLKENSERAGIGFRQSKLRSLLVMTEMSLALLLLIGAVLLIRTLIALHSVNPGFDPRDVVTTRSSLDPKAARRSDAGEIVRDAFRGLSALPGVESAGYTRMLPLTGDFNSIPIIVVGRALEGPSHGVTRWMVVSSSYFDVLKIPLLRGRLFTDADRLGSPDVAIVNQAMARQFWPAGDPLAAQIFIGKGLGPRFAEPARQIIGVVGDVRENALGEPPQPAVFVPGAQLSDARMAGSEVSWIIRTRQPSSRINEAILKQLRRATGAPVTPLQSMQEIIWQSTARQDFNMLLMSIFGGSALLLAAIGIYGVMAYSVQQRTREIGVRIALGAQSSNVRNMVVLQGMRFALVGVAVGVTSAFGLTRFLAGFLFGVRALDPLTFILAPTLLAIVALAAVWFPARRASRVDPIHALRYE